VNNNNQKSIANNLFFGNSNLIEINKNSFNGNRNLNNSSLNNMIFNNSLFPSACSNVNQNHNFNFLNTQNSGKNDIKETVLSSIDYNRLNGQGGLSNHNLDKKLHQKMNQMENNNNNFWSHNNNLKGCNSNNGKMQMPEANKCNNNQGNFNIDSFSPNGLLKGTDKSIK